MINNQTKKLIIFAIGIVYVIIMAMLILFATKKYGVQLSESDKVSVNNELTEIEKKWLQDNRNQTFKLGMDAHEMLYYYKQGDTEYGVLLDFNKEIYKAYGIQLEIQNISNVHILEEKTKKNVIDLSLFNPKRTDLNTSENLSVENYKVYSYLNDPITKMSDLAQKPTGYLVDAHLLKYFELKAINTNHFKPFTSSDVLFDALRRGEVAYIITPKIYMDQGLYMFNLEDNYTFEYNIQYNDEHQQLAAIFVKLLKKYLMENNANKVFDNNMNQYLKYYIQNKYAVQMENLLGKQISYAIPNMSIAFSQMEYPYYFQYKESLFDRLNKILQIDFEYYPSNNVDSKGLYQLFSSKKIDLIAFTDIQEEYINQGVYSEAIYKNKTLIISSQAMKIDKKINSVDLDNSKIGYYNLGQMKHYLDENLVNSVYEAYDTSNGLLQDVVKNKIDYGLISKDDLQLMTTDINKKYYSVIGELEIPKELYFLSSHQELIQLFNVVLPYLNISNNAETATPVKDTSVVKLFGLFIIVILGILLIVASYFLKKYLDQEKEIKLTEDKLVQINQSFEITLSKILEVLEQNMSDSKSNSNFHNLRVTFYSEFICIKLGLKDDYIKSIIKYAPLHDIGRIVLRNEIENMDELMTLHESKAHVFKGYELMKKLNFGIIAENIVLYHHEKWDGQGYLSGLKELEIPLEARIVALANMYDNLRIGSERMPLLNHEEAVEYISNQSSVALDPKLVDLFQKSNLRFKSIFDISLMMSEKMSVN